MKANEAPEKIYITPNFQRRWFTKEIDDESTEYVCKDAFIEKACKYLEENATYTHPRKGTKECIINIPKFIEYMKGE